MLKTADPNAPHADAIMSVHVDDYLRAGIKTGLATVRKTLKDPLRSAGYGWRTTCEDSIPEPRTHQGLCEDAEDLEAFEGAFNSDKHPRYQSGV